MNCTAVVTVTLPFHLQKLSGQINTDDLFGSFGFLPCSICILGAHRIAQGRN